MSNMIKQMGPVPKLSKTKQLDNPYHSSTSASTEVQISRIFLLNDRNRIALSQSSESDTENHMPTAASTKFPRITREFTFKIQDQHLYEQADWAMDAQHRSPNKNINDKNYNICTPQFSKEPEVPIKYGQSVHSKENKIQNISFPSKTVFRQDKKLDNEAEYDRHKQNKQQYSVYEDGKNIVNKQKQSNIKQKKFNGSSNSKIQSKSEKEKQKNQRLSQPDIKVQINEKLNKEYEQVEVIAQQSIDQNMLFSSQRQSFLKVSITQISKPSLNEGSRLQYINTDIHEPTERRGSIIDRIRQQSFIQSQVIDKSYTNPTMDINNNKTGHQTKRKPRRMKIFQNQNNKNTKLPYHEQKSLQFDEDSRRHTPKNRKLDYYASDRKNQRQTTFSPVEVSPKEERSSPQYAICPHTQCILSSLGIIDKLTTQLIHNKSPRQANGTGINQGQVQKQTLKEELSSQALRISMKVDKLLAQLTINDLQQEQTKVRITKYEQEVELLLEKLKQYQILESKQKVGSLQSSNQKYPTSGYTQSQSWQLCQQFQAILKSLHYVQVVQQRYKIWKLRLHHLSERIKLIPTLNTVEQQIMRSNQITQHLNELENSRIYGEACQISVVQSFNKFLDTQSRQLVFALNWIKQALISKIQTVSK